MDTHHADDQFKKTLEYLQYELGTIRTGRAQPSLLEELKAEYYGTLTPLKQLGSLSVPEPMLVVLQVWDATAVPAIEKAIQQANLGLNPSTEGLIIRVRFPSLTEERRKEYVKMAHQKAEAARVAIRAIREDTIKAIRDQENAGTMSEDSAAQLKKDLQKKVDKTNDFVRDAVEQKEQEILRI